MKKISVALWKCNITYKLIVPNMIRNISICKDQQHHVSVVKMIANFSDKNTDLSGGRAATLLWLFRYCPRHLSPRGNTYVLVITDD